jgi:hypothetical protein
VNDGAGGKIWRSARVGACAAGVTRLDGFGVFSSDSGVTASAQFIVEHDAPDEAFHILATAINVNEQGDDLDIRIEGDTNVNLFKLDAGLDCIGIGNAPSANCVLDVQSTTKAFRPPIMPTTSRDTIPNPLEGMVIYNTSTGVLNFYNGAAWGAV